jgi:exonuclease SbcD
MVIAGDIYDRSLPPSSAVSLLDDVLHRICMDMKVPVILIPGNHDSAERVSFGSRQFKQAGLHILGDLKGVTEPVIIPSASGDVAFYGVPYNNPEIVRNVFSEPVRTFDEAHTFLVEKIKQNWDPEQTNVLISHCFVDGSEESESERPLSIGGSDRVSFEPCIPFNYVALGHLHAPQYRGAEHIRYSGSIMKYSFSEQHQKKGVTLVELDESGRSSISKLPLTPLRDMRIYEGDFHSLLDQGKTDPKNDDYLLARLTDRHAIMDAMAQIRAVYPNVLQLEKPGMLSTGDATLEREKLKRTELDMFRDFYSQMRDQDLTAEQEGTLSRIIESLQTEAR